ncbi:MAG TPA: DinB family protein [Mycobacteriales bacterium]|nr:DinB family protein [Mycobacteriales bacterium]
MSIVSDSKDWTWVLARPCPECGFDTSSFARESIGAMIRDNAAQWQQVLRRADARQRPDQQTWSPLEYGCHVRDVHRLYDYRLELMLTEHDPLYPNWDQDLTAVEDRYGDQDPVAVAAQLGSAAEAVAGRFDGLNDKQWKRTGSRSDGASFTVESFARYYAHDWVHHLWDVTARRAATR